MKEIITKYSANIKEVKIIIKVFTLLFLFPLVTQAQFKEVGIGVGVLNYAGDLQKQFSYAEMSPGISAHYRLNYSDAFSVRFNALLGALKASDNEAYDTYSATRSAKFSLLTYEIAALLEYNFFDYRSGGSFIRISPYIFGGIAMMGYFGESEWSDINPDNGNQERFSDNYGKAMSPVIPFGLGVKYNMSPRFDLNVEFGARKTFDDRIDNLSEVSDSSKKSYAHGNENTSDWYFFTGFSISYTFYRIPCPYNFY